MTLVISWVRILFHGLLRLDRRYGRCKKDETDGRDSAGDEEINTIVKLDPIKIHGE